MIFLPREKALHQQSVSAKFYFGNKIGQKQFSKFRFFRVSFSFEFKNK